MDLTFGHIFFSRVYGCIWKLARPLLRRNRRLADGFEHRLVPKTWATPVDLWIQAASGGEAYLAWELLRALPASGDSGGFTRILVTTWTRQGLEVLHGMTAKLQEERPDLHIHVTLFPLDHPETMHRAVCMAQPRLVVLLETELWPGLLFACRRERVPVVVLNGRMTEKSLKGYRFIEKLFPGFWRAMPLKSVCAISEPDAQAYATLFGNEVVQVVPNIKFDRAGHALDKDDTSVDVHSLLPASDIVLLASIREEEEPDILRVLTDLHQKHPSACCVVAPRHMHRIRAWQKAGDAFASAPFPLRLRSQLSTEHPAQPGELILWDTFGELMALYRAATAVFVGGSLAPLGGQNILEALAAGRVPYVGPHLDNFLWALDEPAGSNSMRAQKLLRTCNNATELTRALSAALQSPEDPVSVQKRFFEWLQSRRGGTTRSVAALCAAVTTSGDIAKKVPTYGIDT